MRLKVLYGLAGLAWGLVLGPMFGLWVGAVVAGVSWLFLFGDNPWPESTGWIIPVIASAAALALATAFTVTGYAYGRSRKRASEPTGGAAQSLWTDRSGGGRWNRGGRHRAR